MKSRDYYNLAMEWLNNHHVYKNEEIKAIIEKKIEVVDNEILNLFLRSVDDFKSGTNCLVIDDPLPNTDTLIQLREMGVIWVVYVDASSGWPTKFKRLETAGYKPVKIVELKKELGREGYTQTKMGMLFKIE